MNRALSLIQPWAWLMVVYRGPLEKRIENRTWRPPSSVIGQRIYVHASKKWDKEGAEYILKQLPDLGGAFPDAARHQGVIGSFRIDGCCGYGLNAPPFEQLRWFFGPFGWITSEPVALARPVPWRGSLGVWHVPDELGRMIREST